MSRQRVSYAWALHTKVSPVPVRYVPGDVATGLEYAKELAEVARERSRQNLLGESFAPLTIADLAARDGVPPATVRTLIKRARSEFFGQITDAAIYKRKQRQQQRSKRPARTCQQSGCEAKLDPQTHASRGYCDRHRTPAERVRRHRAS